MMLTLTGKTFSQVRFEQAITDEDIRDDISDTWWRLSGVGRGPLRFQETIQFEIEIATAQYQAIGRVY